MNTFRNTAIPEPNSVNKSVTGLDESLADGIKKDSDDIEMETIEKSITDLIKENHYYHGDNALQKLPHNRFNFRKKRSQLHINIAAGLNSIKYRLKKNYFGQSERF